MKLKVTGGLNLIIDERHCSDETCLDQYVIKSRSLMTDTLSANSFYYKQGKTGEGNDNI